MVRKEFNNFLIYSVNINVFYFNSAFQGANSGWFISLWICVKQPAF